MILILPLLVLEAAVLSLHFWLRRRMDKVFAEKVVREDGSEGIKMDDFHNPPHNINAHKV